MENPSGVSDSPWFVILGGVQSLSNPHAPLRSFAVSGSSQVFVVEFSSQFNVRYVLGLFCVA